MQLINSDCLEALRAMDSDSLDSLVTDPPAGIGFMGKGWDSNKGGRDAWIVWLTEVMRECYRVLKPGAHGLVWAIPRTSHWTATALENAGFEVRDVVTHLVGSGFPKSLDVSKAIDKAAGAEREVVGFDPVAASKANKRLSGELNARYRNSAAANDNGATITAPATDAARQWEGWGTALKPASEHWILVRKPCSEKTVAANVLKHGTGAINIDASRIESPDADLSAVQNCRTAQAGDTVTLNIPGHSQPTYNAQGRFPANLVLSCCGNDPHDDDCAVRMLDEQSYGDSGGASRFFYVAKSSKSDRNRKVKP
jgi:site-specific DNA-methyltransferase (adenine-specific)